MRINQSRNWCDTSLEYARVLFGLHDLTFYGVRDPNLEFVLVSQVTSHTLFCDSELAPQDGPDLQTFVIRLRQLVLHDPLARLFNPHILHLAYDSLIGRH